MAMKFGDPTLDQIVNSHFIPAATNTGFDLFRLDNRPQPGLIDNHMRVAIRTAKFVVCDLTHDNNGAYWEAGFAEGAGKPVFYTCEKAKFEQDKSHFDTNHMFTILWDANDPTPAARELEDAIRNAFPADSTPPKFP